MKSCSILKKMIIVFGILFLLLFFFFYIQTGHKKTFIVRNNSIHGLGVSSQDSYLWDNVMEILPDKYEPFIKRFSVTTDGKDETLASVAVIDSENTSFELSIDYVDALTPQGTMTQNPEFLYTLVHEYMHIVSLEKSQMQPSGEDKGSTLKLAEGTTREYSYANLFYKRFWFHLVDEVKKLEAFYDDTDYIDQVSYDIYTASPNSYINQYCATHPIEDLAETFAYFVLNDKPTGNEIQDKKVLFFYEFQELVELRDSFNKNIKRLYKK